jgi:hypothetical protein
MNKNKPLDQVRSTGANALNLTSKLVNKSEFNGSILERLMDFANSVPDFRRSDKGNIRHRLADIIILMIFARECGCVGRADIIEFGYHHLNKFHRLGMLRKGVPSESTLCRIENGINDHTMADRMQDFAEVFHKELLKKSCGTEIICIDGKAERGTVQQNGRNPDIVSAYSFNTGITLATEACQEKSNEIKAVPLLLNKIEQCAGFLRIPDGDNPLDNTAVHPENYPLVEQMAADCHCSVDDLIRNKAAQATINLQQYATAAHGMPTLLDIMAELDKPGRDPRKAISVMKFDDTVNSFDDLREGLVLNGIVTNITQFGVFVDIGIKENGLVHISELSDHYVSTPSDVVALHQQLRVRIKAIDTKRRRIALTLKNVDQQ